MPARHASGARGLAFSPSPARRHRIETWHGPCLKSSEPSPLIRCAGPVGRKRPVGVPPTPFIRPGLRTMKKTLPALPLVFAACFAAVAQAEPTDLGGGFRSAVCRHRQRLPLPWLFADRLPSCGAAGHRPDPQLGLLPGELELQCVQFRLHRRQSGNGLLRRLEGDVGGGLTLDAGCCTTTTCSSSPKGGNYNNTDLTGRDLRQLHAEVLPRPATSSARPTARAPVPGRHRQFRPGRRLGPGRAPGLSEAQEPDQHEWRFHQPHADYKLGVTSDLKGCWAPAAVGATMTTGCRPSTAIRRDVGGGVLGGAQL